MSATARRTCAAGIAALALAIPVAMNTQASAAPDKKPVPAKATKAPKATKATKATKAPKGPKAPHTKQLLKAISVKDAQLERLATATRTSQLSDDVETTFVSNITADRTALAALRAEAEAVGSTLDAKAERKELHDFRVVNYVLAGNVLRQAEAVEEALAADPEAAAHLAEAVAAALDVTAESTKADVREAREHLRLAKGEADETEEEVPAPPA